MKNEKGHIYSGIPTFMQSPYITLEEVDQYDVAVLGIPVDYGVSYRSGQRLAPKAIREYSFWDRVEGQVLFDFSTNTSFTFNNLKIGDLGDISIWPGNAELNSEVITKTIEQIRSTSFPLIIGGDHSITYAAFLGCKRALEQSGQLPLGLLHFDAHLDTGEGYTTLPRVHHGNVFGQLIREEHLRGDHMVSIGIRGYVPVEWVDFGKQMGIRYYSTPEIRTRTLPIVFTEVVEFLRKTCKSIYLTFDIDCIDPTQVPGTGTPDIGGLSLQDIIPIIRRLAELPLVAFDLVELSPPLDPSGVSTIVACEILWQFLGFASISKK
jgi:agmatinase